MHKSMKVPDYNFEVCTHCKKNLGYFNHSLVISVARLLCTDMLQTSKDASNLIQSLIGASLSEPHTSVTALSTCVRI